MKNIENCGFYTRSKLAKWQKFTKSVPDRDSNPGHPRDILNPLISASVASKKKDEEVRAQRARESTILYYTILYYTILYYTIL